MIPTTREIISEVVKDSEILQTLAYGAAIFAVFCLMARVI